MTVSQTERLKVRSVFISDVHLGAEYSKAKALLAFLERLTVQHVYIVGDFIDGWQLRKAWHWHQVYSRVIRRLLHMELMGTRLYYTPGKQDDFLRRFLHDFGVVNIQDAFVHTSADGIRYMVTHGQSLATSDSNRKNALSWLASWISPRAFASDDDRIASKRFRTLLVDHAKAENCHGIICGNRRKPPVLEQDGVRYVSTGDWVENCCALVEFDSGQLKMVDASGNIISPDDFAESHSAWTTSDGAEGWSVSATPLPSRFG